MIGVAAAAKEYGMHRLSALATSRSSHWWRVFWILLTLGVAAVGAAAPGQLTIP